MTPRMKIGLLGFGKTGTFVADEVLKDPTLDLTWVIKKSSSDFKYASDKLGYKEKSGKFFRVNEIDQDFFLNHPVDIAIDFSSQESLKIYDAMAAAKVKIVSAISNYSSHEKQHIKEISQRTAVIASPNITLGINWLIIASKILKNIIPDADVEVVEEHFKTKNEKSGTALRIAQHLDLDPTEHVNSIRVGGIVGKHEVIFGLPAQTIRLVHESINRSSFARGAIFASKWLVKQHNGLYTMEEVLQNHFKNSIANMKL